ncbi:MAG: hypothetical protein ACK4TG_07880 [Thermaurantiacus sp.]
MSKLTQAELAAKALKAKRAGDHQAPAHPENEPTPGEGAITNPRPDQPPPSSRSETAYTYDSAKALAAEIDAGQSAPFRLQPHGGPA